MHLNPTRFLASMLVFAILASLSAAAGAVDTPSTVLITGANRGLGFEFAKQYAADGWRVIATARNPDAAEDLKALADQHSLVTIDPLDVQDLAQIDALAAKYADQPVDVLLNNAAISGSPSPEQVFRKLNYDLFDDFMETNARGPLKISEAFLAHVEASDKKKIVVITSAGGLFSEFSGGPKGTYFYRASKSAVNMLMLQVAADVKRRGITVVMLNPGLVDTQHMLTEMNEKMNLGLTLVPIEDSIASMRVLIEEKGLDDSGKIYEWNGEPLGY